MVAVIQLYLEAFCDGDACRLPVLLSPFNTKSGRGVNDSSDPGVTVCVRMWATRLILALFLPLPCLAFETG